MYESYTDSDGNNCKVIQIKNNWKKTFWQGDWSKNSTKWTKNTRKVSGVDEIKEGHFFISLFDFKKFFQGVFNFK